MRKIVVSLALLILLAGLGYGVWFFWQQSAANRLTVFTWVDYFDPEAAAQFEEEFGARIEWSYFEDDADRDARMNDKDAPEFDLVLASHKSVARYRRHGRLASLDLARVPNLKQISKRWLGFIPEAEGYVAPYFWGSSGIVYRSDLVKTPITSWMQLFKPAAELRGRILMLRDPRELVSAAMLAQRKSPNTLDPIAYQKAQKLLLEQKPYVREYRPLVPNEEEAIVTTDAIAAAPAFNGDAMFLKQYKETLEYVVPEEGGFLWADFWVVMSKSTNKELAYQFINFVNRPEVAAKNAEYLNYATPNEGALKLLPKDFVSNRAIFLDEATMARCQPQSDLPARIQRQIQEIGERIVPSE